MKSLQLISLLFLAIIAISLSVAEALEKDKIEKDTAQGCVICKENR